MRTLLLCFLASLSFAVELFFTPLPSTDWLCELVAQASHTLYVCTYSLDERKFLQTLNDLTKRGVDVKILFETGTVPDGARARMDAESSLLHLKFIVIDEAKVILGSANFTENSLKKSINDVLYFEDREIATVLADFFESLWNGELKRFQLQRDGFILKNYDLEDLLLKELSKTKRTLDVAMFALTHPKVWSMLKILSSRNVRIRLLVDRWFLSNSKLKELPESGVQVRVFEPFTLHTKLFIIDGRTVISGSANVTKSAYEKNAELMMVIRRRELVCEYEELFETLWREGAEP
ncbi:phospholipase D-like domain-containing protein [Thermotoga caldifontis]|uniref:phospholipase D-like domain-containing protein n=1 Tax=Thermotoga caldifontis TaxID=1508419 RepID=UPI0005972C9C|nr:phospholipase D-like domain-containing protein [Thermotoga caldifontis]